jgi:hypothetical protein
MRHLVRGANKIRQQPSLELRNSLHSMSLLELYSEPYERKAPSGPNVYGDTTEWPD